MLILSALGNPSRLVVLDEQVCRLGRYHLLRAAKEERLYQLSSSLSPHFSSRFWLPDFEDQPCFAIGTSLHYHKLVSELVKNLMYV